MQPGLAPREIVEQSSCFCFDAGYVITYNGELTCRTKSSLPKDFTGAVQAGPLLAQLKKWKEDEVEFEVGENEIILTGKHDRSAGITMKAEILLPIDRITPPAKWQPLQEDFTSALAIVQECANPDTTSITACIHLHPKFIESCNPIQFARYRMRTGFKEPFLVKRENMKHLMSLDMTKFSETEGWVHFKNPAGVVLSTLRMFDAFPDPSSVLKCTGEPSMLPKSLGSDVESAEVFSSEDKDNNFITVQLKEGLMRVRGRGNSGWYKGPKIKNPKYKGAPFSFTISPKLLVELCKRHNEVEISSEYLIVNSGKLRYVARLGIHEEKE